MRLVRSLLIVTVVVALVSPLTAAVKMPKIFGNNMVLQRDIPVPVWGWADKGEKVSVSFAGQEKSATAGDDGKWSLKLDPLKASKAPAEMKISGTNMIAIKDILVGEVWICSGQSNMAMVVSSSLNAPAEIAAATNPIIRHFRVPNTQSPTKKDDLAGGAWEVCSPQTAGNFTAVGYFFARELVKELDIPIGLINSSWGGTRIEPWTCPEGFNSVPELKDIPPTYAAWDPSTDAGRAVYSSYIAKLKEWMPKAESAIAAKTAVPELPASPVPDPNHQLPTKLFNAMINPLVPFAIRGAIWYQGESNGGEGVTYLHKKKALVNGWRQLWKQGDFPFYHVQLANFQKSDINIAAGGDGWAKLREAELQSLAIPQYRNSRHY